MRNIKKVLLFLFRLDNFNRIIVFISMTLFIVFPSMVLYHTNDENYNFLSIMPSILFLGVILGNGILAFLKPLKTTWIYFLILFISFPIINNCYDITLLHNKINYPAIEIFSMIYIAIGLLLNLIYFFNIIKRKSKSFLNEKTNNDSIFDFLGGQKKNDAIAKKLDKAILENTNHKSIEMIKHKKLSRLTRIITFTLSFIIAMVYMITSITRTGTNNNLFFSIMLLILIISSITFISSLLYPSDFKYIYYFNIIFLYICAIISSNEYQMKPFLLIVTIISICLSFLITLIVEGRTWTGAEID